MCHCLIFSISQHLLAILLTVHRLCGVIEERLSHFLPLWLRTGWRVWSAREILRRGCELNPGHREDRQWAIPLSSDNPGHREDRQWAIPLSYHDPGHREDRQWAIPLRYHDWLSYLLSMILAKHMQLLISGESSCTRGLSGSDTHQLGNTGVWALVQHICRISDHLYGQHWV